MKKNIKLPHIAFPFLTGLTFLLVALETYTYIGFLRKYLIVDSRFFIMITLVLGFFVFSTTIGKSGLVVLFNNLILRINYLMFPLLLIIYLVMQTLDSFKYHNYIFSTYHLQPDNLFYLVLLSGGLILLKKIKLPIVKVLMTPGSSIGFVKFIRLCIVLVFTFLLVDNFAISFNQAIGSNMYILLHSQASYNQKMQNYWGFFYDYIVFVKDNTPENSTIMIPPKELPWLSTGNESLVRYFLYPRNLVQGTNEKYFKLEGVDYILMAWGEWPGADEIKYGWPKIEVATEEMLYFGENKNWGIIKIKK